VGVRVRGERFHRTARVWSGPGAFPHPRCAFGRTHGWSSPGRRHRRPLPVWWRRRRRSRAAAGAGRLTGSLVRGGHRGDADPRGRHDRALPVRVCGAGTEPTGRRRPGPRRTDRRSLLHRECPYWRECEPGTPVRTPRRPARAGWRHPTLVGQDRRSRVRQPPARHGPSRRPPVVRRPPAAITRSGWKSDGAPGAGVRRGTWETVERFLPPHREIGRATRRSTVRSSPGSRRPRWGGWWRATS
jgi:hypothetical protein